MRELPESTDPAAMVRAPSHSLGIWTETAQPEPVSVGGVAGQRFHLAQRGFFKESAVVRRGKELYVFSIVGQQGDVSARDEIRGVLDGLAWTK